MDHFDTSKIFKISRVEKNISETLFDSAKNETGLRNLEIVDQFLFGYTIEEGLNGVYSLTAVVDKNTGAKNVYISPYFDDNTLLDKDSTNAYEVYVHLILSDALRQFVVSINPPSDDIAEESIHCPVQSGCSAFTYDAATDDEHVLKTLCGRWV